MKGKIRVGIVSYNIHYNYSNYGSILQTYALQEIIKKLFNNIEPIVIDYCPDNFLDSDPTNPLNRIKDKNSSFYFACEKLLGDIRENERKIRDFIKLRYNLSKNTYNSCSFNSVLSDECLDGFICGSDAIWSIEYFKKFDNAYYAEYECMKQANTIAYAASFGETEFDDNSLKIMLSMMKNYRAIGIRESYKLSEISNNTSVDVKRVLDPTLLLPVEHYQNLMSPRLVEDDYLLIYSRRYNSEMYDVAKFIADKNNLRIVEISLNIENNADHILMYSAGVEEFLSLINYASFIITNSLHGTIFSTLMKKQFFVFPRKHGDKKIDEFLNQFGLDVRKISDVQIKNNMSIDYDNVYRLLNKKRKESYDFLEKALNLEKRSM